MQYRYSIKMKWINEVSDMDTSTDSNSESSFMIEPKHINRMSVFNDYEGTNMPILQADLTLDKKYIDKMIKNSKTAKIFLYIYKYEGDRDDGANIKQLTNYTGEMSYFINQDINYNKELDYSDDPDRKDMLQIFTIGLMFNDCIETNKQTANTTFVNTTTINAVAYFLQRSPYLIDNFDFNDSITQLIVPPQESLSKTISFLNSIKVFYNTPYRFFIEPGCTYLLNSSGDGLAKDGEEFNTCMFNISPIDTQEAMEPGMSEDAESGCYKVNIHAKDSYYTIDSDTNKLYSTIRSIIDPGIQNSITLLDTVHEAIGSINKMKQDISGIVNTSVNTVKRIPSNLTTYAGRLLDNVDNIHNVIDGDVYALHDAFGNPDGGTAPIDASVVKTHNDAIALIEKMKTLTIRTGNSESGFSETKLVDNAKCDRWIQSLTNNLSEINKGKDKSDKVPAAYKKTTSQLINILHDTTSLTSMVNAVSPTNIGDNVSTLLSSSSKAKENVSTHAKSIQTDIIPKVNECLKIPAYIDSSVVVVKEALEVYHAYLANQAALSSGDPTDLKDNPFALYAANLESASKKISESAEKMVETITEYKSENTKAKSLIETIDPQLKGITNIPIDLKSTVTGTWDTLVNLGKSAKKSLDNIVRTAKSNASKIKSLDFSIDSLQDLQNDINIVRDLSGIGMLGISNFDVDLNIMGSKDAEKSGDMILRIANDNANIVKNIKADIENHECLLSITKTDLDTMVFTPNKKYIINNYDAHSNKDGKFLLIKKSDFFIRSGEEFTISTQLEFAKIAADANSNTQPDTEKISAKKLAEEWYQQNADTILQLASSDNLTWGSLRDILVNAQSMQNTHNMYKKSTPVGSLPNNLSKKNSKEWILDQQLKRKGEFHINNK